MITKEEASSIVEEAIEEFNELNKGRYHVLLAEDTVLFGPQGTLDSLGLVSLIVEIEAMIEEKFGYMGSLTDERAMSQKRSPFRTIGSLTKYISQLGEARPDE